MSAAEAITWEEAFAVSIQTGDPLLFATGVLGFLMPGVPNPDGHHQLEPWQVIALRKFRKAWRHRFTKKGRIAIKSGHGTGKTCFLSILILFVLFAGGPDTKIPVVANSQDQLRDGLWPEVNKWIQCLPKQLRAEIDWQKEKICIKCDPESAFAVRRTATKHRPEALQGMHAKTILAILEEASGIPEETIEAGAGTLSTPGAIAVAVGNPTRATGFFHRIHTAPVMKGVWDTMTVSSEEVPRARGHIDDIIQLYGKDSNKYRVRVTGEFPTKDDDVVIPYDWVASAKNREVEVTKVWPVWACDPARFGDDRSVLSKRQGNTLLGSPNVWQNLDGGQVAAKIVEQYRRTPVDMRPKAIVVDVIGIGASVVDFLKRDGELAADDVLIVSANVAEGPANDAMNHRLRDELWWMGRQWFEGRDVAIPMQDMNAEQRLVIDELIAELTTPTYDFTAANKRIVLSKKDMKKDLGRSPDIADSFLLTFAAPVYPRPVERHRSWEAAYQPNPWGA